MSNWRGRIVAVCVILGVCALLPAGPAHAQVALHSDRVTLKSGGSPTAELYATGLLSLGNNGATGFIDMFQPDGSWTTYFGSGVLDLGWNAYRGGVLLRDNDSTQTITVNLDGSLGYIILGTPGGGGNNAEDGDLRVNDTDGSESVYLDGATGNVTNQFSGNGLAKAWARVAGDGSVQSCWRCNVSASETQRISTGYYEVDFSLATDISGRPWVCTVGNGAVLGSPAYSIGCVTRDSDPSSIFVAIKDDTGTAVNAPFTIVIY